MALLVIGVVLVLLVAALVVAIIRARRLRPHHQDTRLPFADDTELRPRMAVVVNPTKVADLAATKRRVAEICERRWLGRADLVGDDAGGPRRGTDPGGDPG